MKISVSILLLAALSVIAAGAAPEAAVTTANETMSYAVGVDLARNLKRQAGDLDIELLIQGLKDEMVGSPLLLPEAQIRAAVVKFQTDMRRERVMAARKAGLDNKQAGDAFLAANKIKDGVLTLPCGLQYTVLATGTGPTPAEGATVEIRYRGTFIDGTEFDRSEPDGTPKTVALNSVIPGWREALKMMPIGSKWRLFVPPLLAYGSRPAAHNIGPNATLIFELELVAIKE